MSLKKTVSTLKLKKFIEKNSSPTVPLNTSYFYVTPKSILIVARNRKKKYVYRLLSICSARHFSPTYPLMEDDELDYGGFDFTTGDAPMPIQDFVPR
jgi:hypothetical protein